MRAVKTHSSYENFNPAARGRSKLQKLRDAHGPPALDARARGHARQNGHRAGARVGQAHVVGDRAPTEDEVAEAVVAAGVAAGDVRHLYLLAPAGEVLHEVCLRVLLDLPRLALVVAHFEAAALA